MVAIHRHDIAHSFAQFDPEQGSTIITPEAPGQGYWAGAPSIFYDTQQLPAYLSPPASTWYRLGSWLSRLYSRN
jgi:hypothetical protein